jgi:hypothetical protein
MAPSLNARSSAASSAPAVRWATAHFCRREVLSLDRSQPSHHVLGPLETRPGEVLIAQSSARDVQARHCIRRVSGVAPACRSLL